MATKRASVTFLADGCPQTVTVAGRTYWAFTELKTARERGCTPIDNPAPRWSAYVFNLREAGFNVETVTEMHGGPYPGHHARYVLRSPILAVVTE